MLSAGLWGLFAWWAYCTHWKSFWGGVRINGDGRWLTLVEVHEEEAQGNFPIHHRVFFFFIMTCVDLQHSGAK